MFKRHRFEVLDSTNDKAKELDFDSIVIASIQKKGKGRFSRKWSSPLGGLWFSIVLKPERKAFEYTFIAALAVLKAIKTGRIKWPNDIIYRNKKICGILTETEVIGEDIKKMIIGIGVNINNDIPQEMKDIAVSLKDIKNKELDKERILNQIISNFEKMNKRDFNEILRRYKKNCSTLDKNIKVKSIDRTIEGKAIDIDETGKLILETKGKIIKVDEGEVSLL